MIVNDNLKFLFIHIQKTGGSSISSELTNLGSYEIYQQHSFIDVVEKKYDNYFKFCFVRNPWDRLVSWYEMLIKLDIDNNFSTYIKKNSKNFSEFLKLTNVINETKIGLRKIKNKNYPKSIAINQIEYVSDKDGNIKVDFIGKFESLQTDYDYIRTKLNLHPSQLPHINKGSRGDYRLYYSDNDAEIVYQMYKKDIDYFGYRF